MIRLDEGAIVETQQSAESFHAPNRTEIGPVSLGGLDQSGFETLVIPLPMMVSGLLACGFSQRPFAEEDHLIETLIFDRPDKSFSVGVQVE